MALSANAWLGTPTSEHPSTTQDYRRITGGAQTAQAVKNSFWGGGVCVRVRLLSGGNPKLVDGGLIAHSLGWGRGGAVVEIAKTRWGGGGGGVWPYTPEKIRSERKCSLDKAFIGHGGGGGWFGTRPWFGFVCLWRRLLTSRHCTRGGGGGALSVVQSLNPRFPRGFWVLAVRHFFQPPGLAISRRWALPPGRVPPGCRPEAGGDRNEQRPRYRPAEVAYSRSIAGRVGFAARAVHMVSKSLCHDWMR